MSYSREQEEEDQIEEALQASFRAEQDRLLNDRVNDISADDASNRTSATTSQPAYDPMKALTEHVDLRLSNEFSPLSDPEADTLIWIGIPPAGAGQTKEEYQHMCKHFNKFFLMRSVLLKGLDSDKINKFFRPNPCIRAQKKFKDWPLYKALDADIKAKIKYHINLEPPNDDDEALILITSLSCSHGVLHWHLAQHIHTLSPSHVGGVDHFDTSANPYFIDIKTALEGPPKIVLPVVPEYCAVRHRSGLERLLNALAGNDPKLDSAPKVWTYFALADYFGCAKDHIVNRWILAWLNAPNSHFIQNNPESAYRIGMQCQSSDLVRDAFSVLVGEKALMDVYNQLGEEVIFNTHSVHGRPLENLDDDERSRIGHAASTLIQRMRGVIHELVDQQDWISKSSEYQKICQYKPKDEAEQQIINEAKAAVKAFLSRRMLSYTIMELEELHAELDTARRATYSPHTNYDLSFIKSYNALPYRARIFTRTFWFGLLEIDLSSTQYKHYRPLNMADIHDDAVMMDPVLGLLDWGPGGRIEAVVRRLEDVVGLMKADRDSSLEAVSSKVGFVEPGPVPYTEMVANVMEDVLDARRVDTPISAPTKRGKNSMNAQAGPSKRRRSNADGVDGDDTASESIDSASTGPSGETTTMARMRDLFGRGAASTTAPQPHYTYGSATTTGFRPANTFHDSYAADPTAINSSWNSVLPTRPIPLSNPDNFPFHDLPSAPTHQPGISNNMNGHLAPPSAPLRVTNPDAPRRRAVQQFSDIPAPPPSSSSPSSTRNTTVLAPANWKPTLTPSETPILNINIMWHQLSQLISQQAQKIAFPDHIFHGTTHMPIDLIDHVIALSDEEWKFLPLWADGCDDGTGGVFEEAIPNLEAGGFRGGKRGMKMNSSAESGGGGGGFDSATDESFSEIGADEGVSTVGRASRDATDGTETVKSFDDKASVVSGGTDEFMNQDDVYEVIQQMKMEQNLKDVAAGVDGPDAGGRVGSDAGDDSTIMGARSEDDVQGTFFGSDDGNLDDLDVDVADAEMMDAGEEKASDVNEAKADKGKGREVRTQIEDEDEDMEIIDKEWL